MDFREFVKLSKLKRKYNSQSLEIELPKIVEYRIVTKLGMLRAGARMSDKLRVFRALDGLYVYSIKPLNEYELLHIRANALSLGDKADLKAWQEVCIDRVETFVLDNSY